MYIPGDEPKRSTRTPAKLNLYLAVGERREDGFHELETLLVPIRIWDTLTLVASRPSADGRPGPIRLRVHAAATRGLKSEVPAIPAGKDNLVHRALKLLQQRSGCRFGAAIDLMKRIPPAAGLGGGSSDAAAALRLANQAWNLNWPQAQLAELAAELGSDVPFFLAPGPAVCRGRGEQIERLAPMPSLDVVVVKPSLGLKTSDVYQAHDALSGEHQRRLASCPGGLAAALTSGRWGDVARWMRNGLQAAAASLTPWVDEISGIFHRLDFVAHQLSGSGSAYFGVCRHAQHARRLANILRTRQLGLVYATRGCQ